LGQLSRAVNVTSLHLEILPEPSGCAGPLSPSAPAGPGKSPSELARLQVIAGAYGQTSVLLTLHLALFARLTVLNKSKYSCRVVDYINVAQLQLWQLPV
jgi:hypothetical protein